MEELDIGKNNYKVFFPERIVRPGDVMTVESIKRRIDDGGLEYYSITFRSVTINDL